MFKIISKEKKPGSLVETKIEIEFSLIEARKKEAIKEISSHAEFDGFRKGHVPESVIVQKIGEFAILEEAADLALRNIVPEILAAENIFPLGMPKITITKLAEGNPLEATILTAVVPEVKVPDFKKIAKSIKIEKIEAIEDKDVDQVIEELKAHKHHEESGHAHNDADGHTHDDIVIDDAFVRNLGNFETVEDFRKQIKENLKLEKEYKAKEKRRMTILDELVKEANLEIPEILVENELDRMTNEFANRLKNFGHTLESYKKESNKKDEEIRAEWKERAEIRVKSELLLLEIIKKEGIKANPIEIEKEVKELSLNYPGVEQEKLTSFAEEMLAKEEVFKLLEAEN